MRTCCSVLLWFDGFLQQDVCIDVRIDMCVGMCIAICMNMCGLYGFLRKDVSKWYPDLVGQIKISLMEAGPGLLSSFDKALSDW